MPSSKGVGIMVPDCFKGRKTVQPPGHTTPPAMEELPEGNYIGADTGNMRSEQSPGVSSLSRVLRRTDSWAGPRTKICSLGLLQVGGSVGIDDVRHWADSTSRGGIQVAGLVASLRGAAGFKSSINLVMIGAE